MPPSDAQLITQLEKIASERSEEAKNLSNLYDLPLRPPEVYSSQFRPWLATKPGDILHWIQLQEAMIPKKAGKFASITDLPGPMANADLQIWRDMRARLTTILVRGHKRVERQKRRQRKRKMKGGLPPWYGGNGSGSGGQRKSSRLKEKGEDPFDETSTKAEALALMKYMNSKKDEFNREEKELFLNGSDGALGGGHSEFIKEALQKSGKGPFALQKLEPPMKF